MLVSFEVSVGCVLGDSELVRLDDGILSLNPLG